MNEKQENSGDPLDRAAKELRDDAAPFGPPRELVEQTLSAMAGETRGAQRWQRLTMAALAVAAILLVGIIIKLWPGAPGATSDSPYQVVRQLPASSPPPNTETVEKLVLKPGVGVGDLKWGATPAQIVAAVGEPSGILAYQNSELLQYPSVGLTLWVNPSGGLVNVVANGPPASGSLVAAMRPYQGSTDKGLRIGSTFADVESTYGKQYVTVTDKVINHPERQWKDLVYPNLGLHITVDEQSNRVRGLSVMSPDATGATIPIPTSWPVNTTEMIPTTWPAGTTVRIEIPSTAK